MSLGVSSVHFCRKCGESYTTLQPITEGYCEDCQKCDSKHSRALVVGDMWEGRGSVVRITNADRRYVSYWNEQATSVGHSTKEAFRRRFRPIHTSDTPVSRSR